MEKKDFIKGQYYWISSRTGWITRFDRFEGDGVMSSSSMTVETPGSWYNGPGWGSFKDCQKKGPARLATAEEIRHIKACEAVERWVPAPKSEVLNQYQIY